MYRFNRVRFYSSFFSALKSHKHHLWRGVWRTAAFTLHRAALPPWWIMRQGTWNGVKVNRLVFKIWLARLYTLLIISPLQLHLAPQWMNLRNRGTYKTQESSSPSSTVHSTDFRLSNGKDYAKHSCAKQWTSGNSFILVCKTVLYTWQSVYSQETN